MKKPLAALALMVAAGVGPAFADVGVSIRLGEPEFYGRIDVDGGYYRPRVIYDRPVIIDRRYRNMAPVYVRAPRDHYRHWRRYCARYDACTRPVYFVQDEWYTRIYAPRYRQLHARNFEGRRYPDPDDGDERGGRWRRR